MVEVGRSERLLKNCRNKGSKLGWAKNKAQRVNTIKATGEDADKALLTFKWENNVADTFRAFGYTLWRLDRL